MRPSLTVQLALLALLAPVAGPACGPAEQRDVVADALIRLEDQGANPELRWGVARTALPEGMKGPAEADLPLPPEVRNPAVRCVELAGQGLTSVAIRFDRTFVCFYEDQVYLRGALRRVEGESARNECTNMVEGLSQDYGVGGLPLALDACVDRLGDGFRPAHCERKKRQVGDDDRVRHLIQVEHYGPPRTRIELEERLELRGETLELTGVALRVEPKRGDPWCEMRMWLAEPGRRAAALAGAAGAAEGAAAEGAAAEGAAAEGAAAEGAAAEGATAEGAAEGAGAEGAAAEGAAAEGAAAEGAAAEGAAP